MATLDTTPCRSNGRLRHGTKPPLEHDYSPMAKIEDLGGLDKLVESQVEELVKTQQNAGNTSIQLDRAGNASAMAGADKKTQENNLVGALNTLGSEYEDIKVKEEDTEDPDVVFIGSRPCDQTIPFPLPIDARRGKKRKRAPGVKKERRKKSTSGEGGETKPHGRPKKYLWDERESESEFQLSDLDEDQWALARSEMPIDTTRRKTSRWVCYSDVEENMFLHWLVQGRSLNYVVNAFKGLRSRNGLYQKMAAIRRQFDDTKFVVDKNSHYDPKNGPGITAPGPIPRQDLQAFKMVLFEMHNKPSIKQRISGGNREEEL